MRKIMISLIVFAVVIIACCAGIASADDLTYGDLKYTVSNNQVTITGYVGEPTAIIVPQEINETPIIKIGNRAFQSCNSLSSIQISEGIEELGQYAFQNCKNLTTVELPNSLTTIGSGAFSGCSNLLFTTFILIHSSPILISFFGNESIITPRNALLSILFILVKFW